MNKVYSDSKRLIELIDEYEELNEVAKVRPEYAFAVEKSLIEVERQISQILEHKTLH